MKNTIGLKTRTIAILSTLSLAILILTSLFPQVYAAVPWTKYTGKVYLKEGAVNELFVQNAWVIKDGGTYKMWYTHSRADMNIGDLANNIKAILSSEIIGALVNLDLDTLLDELATIDDTALWNFMTATTTVIGYATSTDGIDWDIVNDQVLDGTAGEWEHVGMPCVIKDGSTYKMWFTHSDTTLDQTSLASYLDDLDDPDPDVVRNAIIGLINSTTAAIGYAESSDGIDWGSPQLNVFSGTTGSGIWDSVATPSVIKNSDTDYEMWYTRAQTSLTSDDIDDILDNIGDFGTDDLWNILGEIQSTIGYATATDGTDWTEVDNSVLSGTSGGIWDSVATPCVLKNGSSYEMWYTHPTTDLDATSFSNLFGEIQSLETDILDLWDSFATDDLTTFLTNFDAFFGVSGPFDSVRPYLDETSTRIGYTTSDDGQVWALQNPNALVGNSDYPWSSVAFPSVVYENGVYEIWFTKGIDELTAQNLLDVAQGDILPIGYADGFQLVAETDASLDKDTDDIAVIMVNIDRGKDAYTDLTKDIPGGVSAYTAQASGNPAGIVLIEVRGVSPFDSPAFDPGTGIFSASSSSPQQPSDTTVAKIVARLIGDALTQYDLTIEFQKIMANDPPEMNVTEENSNTITFLRGDANKDGMVDIADAMYIAQYTVFLRTLDELNALNGASVAHDGASGDMLDIADAMFIAQYTVFIRDANFELIP